jgi:hypothetical protein
MRKPSHARKRKPQPGAQGQRPSAGAETNAPTDPFAAFRDRAEALAPGDEASLKALLSDIAREKYSEARADPIIRAAARATGISIKLVKGLLVHAAKEAKRRENETPAAQTAKQIVVQTERDVERARLWASCRAIAESKTLLADMRGVTHRLGVVGEDAAITAAYLICASRLLKRIAISYLRRGASASGKNHLITAVLRLFPRTCIIPISSATPMALIYYRGDEAEGADVDRDEGDENALAHKIIVIAEAAMLAKRSNGDEHPMTGMLRVILSDGELDHLIPLPSNDGGAPKTIHIKRRGPIVLLMTSARQDVESEMLTRLLSSDADESNAQTLNVVKSILTPALQPASAEDVAKWIDFQRWLAIDSPYEVVVPFREALSAAYVKLIEKYPATVQLRMRRDVTALVAAVEASALVHRAQRKKDAAGRIIAKLVDYRHAHGALNEGMAALYDLRPSAAVKATLDAVITIAEEAETAAVNDGVAYTYNPNKSYRITVEAVRKKLGVASKDTAAQRLEKLVDFGFIEEDESERGKGRGAPRSYKILMSAAAAQAANVFPNPVDVAKNHRRGRGSKTAVQNVQDVRNDAGADPSRTSRTFCTADSTPSPPPLFSRQGSAQGRGNARKSSGLTAEEDIAAVRGAGGLLTLWPDGVDFEVDLRSVADPVIRDLLFDAIVKNHDAILTALRREAGLT